MKQSIQWHKDCLKNMQQFLLEKQEEVRGIYAQCDRVRAQCLALDAQIIEAEMRGVDKFDADKFGKRR